MRANGWPEEPDALIGHVRIRGSPGRVTARGDPARCDANRSKLCGDRVLISFMANLPAAAGITHLHSVGARPTWRAARGSQAAATGWARSRTSGQVTQRK